MSGAPHIETDEKRDLYLFSFAVTVTRKPRDVTGAKETSTGACGEKPTPLAGLARPNGISAICRHVPPSPSASTVTFPAIVPSARTSSADCAVNSSDDVSTTTSCFPSTWRSEFFSSRATRRSVYQEGTGKAMARQSRKSSAGAYSYFGAGSTTPSFGPSTRTELETKRRIACSGLTQGPPD